ncbi:MAG: hypothetical protein GEV10_11235 [Streptosporangiales bacterium]|nr:hypothetical protein [Streptosporangiales bacterium]
MSSSHDVAVSVSAPRATGTPDALAVVVAVALVVVLAVLGVVVGVVEAFVHPVRLWGLPAGVAVTVVVNFLVPQLVGRGTRSRMFALVPCATWLLSVIMLSVGRPEGDFVVPGNGTGYAFLLAGTIASVLGVVLLPWYGLPARVAQAPGRPGG